MMGFLFSREGAPPSRFRLLLPFIVLIVAIGLYTAYWIYASGEIRKSARDWIMEQEAAGYDIDHGRMRVVGYPLRFTLDVVEPEITAPPHEGGWQARFERLGASAMPWNFNHWILTLGGPLILAAEAEGRPALYQADAAGAQVSIRASGGGTQSVGVELENLVLDAIEGPAPAISGIGRLTLSGRTGEDDRLFSRFEIEQVSFHRDLFEPEFAASFGLTGDLLRFDGAITRFEALAREGDAREWIAAGGELVVNGAQLDWGPARLGATGELGLDAQMRPVGRLSVVISDPETLVEAMVGAGLVQPGQGDALRLAAMMAPRREEGIALPLRFQEGGVFLGPARIGSVGALD